ncbi:MAG: mechanosensitive ion channel [Candidatus Latescibacteria bacterium]|nr:mechanosensitive ion channel [Candidatus Latescibacterota bacterium]
MDSFMQTLPNLVQQYGWSVIAALLILIIGRFAAGLISRGIKRGLAKRDVDEAIVSFAGSLSYTVILVAVVLAVLAQFGVQTASFVAVLAAGAFAVGFALQGSLSNFAAGVLILVLRPFKIGDVIEAAGVLGTVKEIHLFTTVMSSPDNIMIMVPNSQIYGHTIKNYAGYDTRRVDMVIGIGYSSSMQKAQELLLELIKADERILADPEPTVAVAELADSSVNFNVRPWVKREDYWAVRFDLTEKIKEAFDANGIEIPFPQRTIHMSSDEPSAN